MENIINEISKSILELDRENIKELTELICNTIHTNKKVYVIGNGGSLSTASHFVADLIKWSSPNKLKQINAHCFSDNTALMSALQNDINPEDNFSYLVERFMERDDLLVVISVNGGKQLEDRIWSKNLLNAVKSANKKECTTFGISGNNGGLLKDSCDKMIIINSDNTPVVESIHLSICHIIANELKKINQI